MIGFVSASNENIAAIQGKHPEIICCGVNQVLEYLEKLEWLGYDSETLGLDPYTSEMITIQLGDANHQFVIDVTSIDIQYFKDILERKPLIGHNMKFDLRFLYHQRIIPTKVYDTFLAEKTTRLGITAHRSSLADTVYRHLGVMLDKSERANINGKFTVPFVLYSALDVTYLHQLKDIQLDILKIFFSKGHL